MMMARPNWRAEAATTSCMMAPSRTCRCQSSGRVRVTVDRVLAGGVLEGTAGMVFRVLCVWKEAENGLGGCNSGYSNAVLIAVGLDRVQCVGIELRVFSIADDIVQTCYRNGRDAFVVSQLLNRRARVATAFLAVQGNQQCRDVGTLGTNQRDGLAHGGAGGNDIVDDDYALAQLCANQQATFAMILDLLAIVSK